MLDTGDRAPDFELKDDEGNVVSLSELVQDGPLIVYFYPADFTPACTAEACEIRDLHPDIKEVNATIVGISPQSESSHARFRDRYELPFKLLYDRNKTVIRAFGVNGPMGFGVRRVTYLINQDKLIEKRVLADFAVKQHIRFIEEVVEDLGNY
jgi:peroxiredoxin Q/BCP